MININEQKKHKFCNMLFIDKEFVGKNNRKVEIKETSIIHSCHLEKEVFITKARSC